MTIECKKWKNMNDKDKRYQKTHQRICQCYIDLWKEKLTSEITVTELTKKAKINRSSFYLHYKSMKDVKKEIEGKILKEIRPILDRYPDTEKKVTEEIVYSFYLDVGKLCAKHEEALQSIFGRYGDIEFIKAFEDIMKNKTFNLLIRAIGKNCTPDQAESCRCLSCSFVAGWKAALDYCCETKDSKRFIQMMKALDGDAMNNIDRIKIKN